MIVGRFIFQKVDLIVKGGGGGAVNELLETLLQDKPNFQKVKLKKAKKEKSKGRHIEAV